MDCVKRGRHFGGQPGASWACRAECTCASEELWGLVQAFRCVCKSTQLGHQKVPIRPEPKIIGGSTWRWFRHAAGSRGLKSPWPRRGSAAEALEACSSKRRNSRSCGLASILSVINHCSDNLDLHSWCLCSMCKMSSRIMPRLIVDGLGPTRVERGGASASVSLLTSSMLPARSCKARSCSC